MAKVKQGVVTGDGGQFLPSSEKEQTTELLEMILQAMSDNRGSAELDKLRLLIPSILEDPYKVGMEPETQEAFDHIGNIIYQPFKNALAIYIWWEKETSTHRKRFYWLQLLQVIRYITSKLGKPEKSAVTKGEEPHPFKSHEALYQPLCDTEMYSNKIQRGLWKDKPTQKRREAHHKRGIVKFASEDVRNMESFEETSEGMPPSMPPIPNPPGPRPKADKRVSFHSLDPVKQATFYTPHKKKVKSSHPQGYSNESKTSRRSRKRRQHSRFDLMDFGDTIPAQQNLIPEEQPEMFESWKKEKKEEVPEEREKERDEEEMIDEDLEKMIEEIVKLDVEQEMVEESEGEMAEEEKEEIVEEIVEEDEEEVVEEEKQKMVEEDEEVVEELSEEEEKVKFIDEEEGDKEEVEPEKEEKEMKPLQQKQIGADRRNWAKEETGLKTPKGQDVRILTPSKLMREHRDEGDTEIQKASFTTSHGRTKPPFRAELLTRDGHFWYTENGGWNTKTVQCILLTTKEKTLLAVFKFSQLGQKLQGGFQTRKKLMQKTSAQKVNESLHYTFQREKSQKIEDLKKKQLYARDVQMLAESLTTDFCKVKPTTQEVIKMKSGPLEIPPRDLSKPQTLTPPLMKEGVLPLRTNTLGVSRQERDAMRDSTDDNTAISEKQGTEMENIPGYAVLKLVFLKKKNCPPQAIDIEALLLLRKKRTLPIEQK